MMPFSFVRPVNQSPSLGSLSFYASLCALSCVLFVRLCQGDLSLLSAWHSLIFDWAKKGKRHKMFGPQMLVLVSLLSSSLLSFLLLFLFLLLLCLLLLLLLLLLCLAQLSLKLHETTAPNDVPSQRLRFHYAHTL